MQQQRNSTGVNGGRQQVANVQAECAQHSINLMQGANNHTGPCGCSGSWLYAALSCRGSPTAAVSSCSLPNYQASGCCWVMQCTCKVRMQKQGMRSTHGEAAQDAQTPPWKGIRGRRAHTTQGAGEPTQLTLPALSSTSRESAFTTRVLGSRYLQIAVQEGCK